jgi:phthiodiolone/phenolphthiodiolone dimycocerosates ketoreductase
MSITPAALLFVITGRTRDDVDEALDSDIAKSFALNASAEFWARHGVQHPLGEDFSGTQDLIPQTMDEHTVLSYTAQVPVSLLKRSRLDPHTRRRHRPSGTMARPRTALCRRSQPQHLTTEPAHLAASIPLATILRGLKKLRATTRHNELEAGNDRKGSRGLIASPFGASATLGTSGGQRP